LPLHIHQTRLYRTLEDLESLRPAWEDLLAAFSGATTFCTWEWLASWWSAFGNGGELLVLAFFDESAQLVGMAPLAISRREGMPFLKLRVLRLLGDGSGDSDNLDFPVRAGWEDAVAAALLDFLAKESRQWNFCEFNTMPEESPVGNRLAKMLGERRWSAYQERRASSAISLPASWEEYLGQLSSKERGKITYYRKRLEKNYQTRFYRCEGKSEIAACLETLFTLHRRRWQFLGQAGSFESAARRQFYDELARRLEARGWLEFWLLDLDGQTVAAQFGFRHDATVFQLQEGFDPAYFSDSVGYVLRSHVVEQLIACGVRRYDFLAGEAASKARWATRTNQYLNVQFARPFGLGSAYLKLIRSASVSKQWLRSHLPGNAWRILHGLKRKFREAGPASSLSGAGAAAPVDAKFRIGKYFSRSDPAVEAK
jgi:CelD/BcsL family acetyltransferase involved in cellulose biosynthesis